MILPCKPIKLRLSLTVLLLFVFSGIKVFAQDGKAIFQSRCASCHSIFNDGTGPKLEGVLDNEFYGGDIKKIANWAYNVKALLETDPHYKQLHTRFPTEMQQFSQSALPEKDIKAIFDYVAQEVAFKNAGPTQNQTPGEEPSSSNQNAIIFGVISLILAVVALILMQVNSNLKKMSDDSESIHRPEPVPFYRNKVYIATISVILFVIAGYFLTQAAIGLQRQKGYQPEQPIYYSHKVHAGLNQINCLYCHGNAWESKSAAIPSVNVCMNCHKTIQEYKGPKLFRENGEEVNANAEIKKLYDYAGFDPKNAATWDASKAKPIEWVRIHSLPDHVYFNHSQHIRIGKVQCQTCHGEITGMDEVKQFSELSMGWCINCHRQTKVDFNYDDKTGNKFYSIYEKFHNDLRVDTLRDDEGKILLNANGTPKTTKPRMDSVTVKDIGGLECQKCHY